MKTLVSLMTEYFIKVLLMPTELSNSDLWLKLDSHLSLSSGLETTWLHGSSSFYYFCSIFGLNMCCIRLAGCFVSPLHAEDLSALTLKSTASLDVNIVMKLPGIRQSPAVLWIDPVCNDCKCLIHVLSEHSVLFNDR